jgi:hypothetical protein
MRLGITVAVLGHLLFHDRLGNTLAFPLRPLIMLSVHKFSVLPEVFRIGIGVSGFLPHFSLAFDQLTIS